MLCRYPYLKWEMHVLDFLCCIHLRRWLGNKAGVGCGDECCKLSIYSAWLHKQAASSNAVAADIPRAWIPRKITRELVRPSQQRVSLGRFRRTVQHGPNTIAYKTHVRRKQDARKTIITEKGEIDHFRSIRRYPFGQHFFRAEQSRR